MATDTSASDLLNRASDADDLQGLLKQGLGGILLAIATGIVSGVLSVADVVIKPLDSLGTELGDLVTEVFGGPGEIVSAGVTATADSLTGAFNVGPLTFALSIGSVLAGFYVLAAYRDKPDTGNLIPGLPFDVPFVGEQEEDED